MAHPDEDLVRRAYEAFAAGDPDTIEGLLADDVEWHLPGDNPLAGDYRGKQQVLEVLARSTERSGGTLRVELHDLLANDQHTVALARLRAERQGRTLDDTTVQVFHVEGGEITSSWTHPFDQRHVDDFWS